MPTPPTIKIQGPLSITDGFQEPCSWPVKIQPPVSVTSTPTALAIAPAIEAAQKTPTGTITTRQRSVVNLNKDMKKRESRSRTKKRSNRQNQKIKTDYLTNKTATI